MTETITTLRLEDVHPNPKNNRGKLNGIEELAANIAENGQLTPIRVQRDGDIYWIIAGHRRHAALTLNGSSTVEAIIEDDIDDATTAKRIVADNACTEAISDLERSRGLQMMLATGVRPEAAAASCGISAETAHTVKRLMPSVQDYGEDMTLERWIAAAEFEGDDEALHAIETASEADWRRVVAQCQTARKMADAVAEAEAIVATSGCELLGVDVVQAYKSPYRYISMGPAAPEGAKYATLTRRDWNGTVAIAWYMDADGSQDAALAAKREERDRLRADLETAHNARLTFAAGYLDGTLPRVSDALLHLASDTWESTDGPKIASREIDGVFEAVCGFTPRIYAAILSVVEHDADLVLKNLGGANQDYYTGRFGVRTRDYLAALRHEGYELSPVETDRLAALEDALVEVGDEDE